MDPEPVASQELPAAAERRSRWKQAAGIAAALVLVYLLPAQWRPADPLGLRSDLEIAAE